MEQGGELSLRSAPSEGGGLAKARGGTHLEGGERVPSLVPSSAPSTGVGGGVGGGHGASRVAPLTQAAGAPEPRPLRHAQPLPPAGALRRAADELMTLALPDGGGGG